MTEIHESPNLDSILEDVSEHVQTTIVNTSMTTFSSFPKIVHPLEEKRLTPEEIHRLQEALNSSKVTEISKAILSTESLMADIKKILTPQQRRLKHNRPRIIGINSQPVSSDQTTKNVMQEPFIVRRRAPRAPSKEPRRPWKPERLDPTKPILQCDACGYQANRRDYMRRHQLRVHSDYRPYQCTLCDFKTTEKHDLDRHLASKYHGGKGISHKRQRMTATVRIKCDQCSYSSKSVKGILRHKQGHAIENQFFSEDRQEGEDDDELVEDLQGVQNHDIHMEGQDGDDSMAVGDDVAEGVNDPVTVLMIEDLMQQEQNG